MANFLHFSHFKINNYIYDSTLKKTIEIHFTFSQRFYKNVSKLDFCDTKKAEFEDFGSDANCLQ